MARSIGLLIVVLLAAAGCASGRTSDKVLVFVDPPDAEAALAAGAWVDPRPLRAYENGHVPGAVHLPFPEVAEGHVRLDGRAPIIVYGDDYNDALAIAMSKRLVELGHDDVRTLRGGLRAWTAAGGAVETGGPE